MLEEKGEIFIDALLFFGWHLVLSAKKIMSPDTKWTTRSSPGI